jgi:hypothetical protein
MDTNSALFEALSLRRLPPFFAMMFAFLLFPSAICAFALLLALWFISGPKPSHILVVLLALAVAAASPFFATPSWLFLNLLTPFPSLWQDRSDLTVGLYSAGVFVVIALLSVFNMPWSSKEPRPIPGIVEGSLRELQEHL